mmetsp:Transcript_24211/g.71874  ORF Transcript_24211/g.71874 Transcript_24211/m.71874 type:complete len:87 (-) Transcript_24211:1133-1393(-)|eukprot:364664-Chlamydomonas_euryale.AAC.6
MATLDDVLSKAADWPGTDKLVAVQDMLNRNKLIINEIHRNHELRSRESLSRNVTLIRELNTNISKVVTLYQELSAHIDAPDSADPV